MSLSVPENKLIYQNQIIFAPESSFIFNNGIFKSTFRTCFRKLIKREFFIIEKKMNKIVSFENIVKLTKLVKTLNSVLLEDYQQKIFDVCLVPKNKNTFDINKFSEKVDQNNPIDQRILRLLNSVSMQEKMHSKMHQ